MKNKKKTTIIIVATGIILVITGFIVYYVIRESVDIREIMKPVYNFKASGDDGPWKKKNRKAGEADGKNNSTKTS